MGGEPGTIDYYACHCISVARGSILRDFLRDLKNRVLRSPFKVVILLGSWDFWYLTSTFDSHHPLTLKSPQTVLRGFLRKKARPRTQGFVSRLRLGRRQEGSPGAWRPITRAFYARRRCLWAIFRCQCFCFCVVGKLKGTKRG